MAIWTIESRTRFGPLELGMSMDEVHSIVGQENLRHRRSALYPGMTTDTCFGGGVAVGYLEDMRVCYVDVARPFCAEYLSMNLMQTPIKWIREAVGERGIATMEEGGKLILPTEGVLIWANEQNFEQVDVVSLFRAGLEEEKERRLQKARDERKKDLANRSPGVQGLRERFHARIEERRRREQSGERDSHETG